MTQDCKNCKCNTCAEQYQCPMTDKEDRRYHCNILWGTSSKTNCLFTENCPAYKQEQ